MKYSFASACVAVIGLVRSSLAGNVVAKFDDIPVNPVLPQVGMIPRPYDGLCYDGFLIGNGSLATFVVPHSETNDIASDVTTRLSKGQPSISTTSCSTPVKSFTLSSFWTGCAIVAANSVASAATTCTILVTGTKKSSSQQVISTFTYKPASLLEAPMQQVSLPPAFNNLQQVTITFPSTVQNAADVLLADDFAYYESS